MTAVCRYNFSSVRSYVRDVFFVYSSKHCDCVSLKCLKLASPPMTFGKIAAPSNDILGSDSSTCFRSIVNHHAENVTILPAEKTSENCQSFSNQYVFDIQGRSDSTIESRLTLSPSDEALMEPSHSAGLDLFHGYD